MKVFKWILMSLTSLILVSCGEEGSGNFNVKGSGSSVTSSQVLSSFNERFDNALSEIKPLVAGGIDPDNLELKIFEILVSKNQDCSEAVQVYHNMSPSYQNILGTTQPTLGQGELEGTFECIVMVASDNIKFSTTQTVGQCQGGVTNTLEVCRSGGSEVTDFPDASFYSSGVGAVEANCGDGEQLVPIYLSTLSSNTASAQQGGAGNTFIPPTLTSRARGINLGAPLVVQGAKTSYFIVDGSSQVTTSSSCDMQPPVFSFQ